MTEGERWTRVVLAELRARRYRPAAWWRFLADSLDRARAQRASNARAHRQTLVIGALGLGAWCFAAPWHPAGATAGAAWWLLVVVMLDWHLGMLEHPDGQPLGRIGLPNLLGLARLAIVPVVPLVPPWAVACLLLASGATDVADGRIARRRGEETRLGRWLDGAADAAVLIAASVALTASGELPVWAAGLVVARHAAQWVGVTPVPRRGRAGRRQRRARPSCRGGAPRRPCGVATLRGGGDVARIGRCARRARRRCPERPPRDAAPATPANRQSGAGQWTSALSVGAWGSLTDRVARL